VQRQNIVLTTFADEQARDPECLKKLYELGNKALRHMPLPDQPTDPPFDMFLRWTVQNPKFIPEALFIATDGERYVGLSHLLQSDEEGALEQELTATDPDYFGRGIAWALKLNTVQYAQEHGFKKIKTWNDTANQAMLSINLRLGYQPQPAWIMMERAI
jgi:RimJ/RimL family protein N-acetyltransferase